MTTDDNRLWRMAMLVAVAFLAVSMLGGCLSKTLRVPVEDHYVQAAVIAADCEKHGFGNEKCTQEDLDAMAQQAKCIDAIVKKQRCDADEIPPNAEDTTDEPEGDTDG